VGIEGRLGDAQRPIGLFQRERPCWIGRPPVRIEAVG